jgi:hypothetical protein
MADEPHVLKGIDYRSVFPFTNLFRTFRMAVHPSKLLLALAMLLTLYVAGRLLDGLWFSRHSAVPNEIELYATSGSNAEFQARREQAREGVIDAYARQLEVLSDRSDLKTPEDRRRAASTGRYLGDFRARLAELRDRDLQAPFGERRGDVLVIGDAEAGRLIRDAIEASIADDTLREGLDARIAYHRAVRDAERTRRAEEAKPNLAAEELEQIEQRATTAAREAEKARDEAIARAKAAAETLRRDRPDEFARQKTRFTRDMRQAHAAAMGTLYGSFGSRANAGADIRGEGIFISMLEYQVRQLDAMVAGVMGLNFFGPGGVVHSVWNFVTVGPGWLLVHHPFYFAIFALLLLTLWAIFGGAISRIAAVHAARDEKISIREALKFSTGKFFSFVSAPLIPLIVLVGIGAVLAIGGLLGNIPWIGPIAIGAVFFLALLAGLLMTLVLLGTIGGFNLMYPTIAVEGSDSFDAISRSFSYLYARPWRLAFLTLVAVAYFALTYLFIRFFLYVLLAVTHYCVGLGMFTSADNGAPLWQTLWRGPADFLNLSHGIDFAVLGPAQSVAAFFIAFWVYLVIALLGAYAISFYLSANTLIYYLMRRDVDATEMDDVYLEQTDEDLAAEPIATPAAAPAAGPTPAGDPAATPPPTA